MPKKGFRGITVSNALYDQIQGTAKAEGLSMPGLIRKMLGALESDYPDPDGAGKKEKKEVKE